jgi:hypothetical protein
MCRKLLDELISESFVVSVGFLSTPGTLRRFLLRSREVREIREALLQGAIDDETIRKFVSGLLAGFRVGARFEHEIALAALAVVLERRATDFADEFLLDLAKLKLAEMPLCIRVARECLKEKVTRSQNKTRVFPSWTLASRFSFRQVKLLKLGSPDSIQTIGQRIDLRPTNAQA